MAASRNFSDAPQVAHDDYPEYVAPKQKPVPTDTSEAIEPAIEPVIASASLLRRRLGDMNAFTFWLLIAVAAIVIIAASVGGAVGGTASARKNQATAKIVTLRFGPTAQSTTPPAYSTTQSSSSTAIQSSAAATASATTDCPASNGTVYKSLFLNGDSGSVPSGAGLTFKKYCAINQGGDDLAEAFVETFNDCIETCAWLNFKNGDNTCDSVTFCTDGIRPGNCWAHNGVNLSPLKSNQYCDTALLQ